MLYHVLVRGDCSQPPRTNKFCYWGG